MMWRLWLTSLLLVSLLSACGFHLRGSMSAENVTETYHLLDRTAEFSFSDKLNRRLESLGLLSQSDHEDAVELIVQSADWLQRKLAIDSLGRVIEWQMEFEVVLVLRTHKMKASDRIAVKARDSWSTDPDNALAASVDLAQIKAGIETRMVDRIIQILYHRQDS